MNLNIIHHVGKCKPTPDGLGIIFITRRVDRDEGQLMIDDFIDNGQG